MNAWLQRAAVAVCVPVSSFVCDAPAISRTGSAGNLQTAAVLMHSSIAIGQTHTGVKARRLNWHEMCLGRHLDIFEPTAVGERRSAQGTVRNECECNRTAQLREDKIG